MAIILSDMLKLNPVFMEACMCSIGGDGMDMDFLAALEASKATKADEDFERALAVTETDFLAALEASKATKADEDFKRALAASLEDAGAVSKAEETPLQQQQQDAVKVCMISPVHALSAASGGDPGDSPPVCRPAHGSLLQSHHSSNLHVQEWTRSRVW